MLNDEVRKPPTPVWEGHTPHQPNRSWIFRAFLPGGLQLFHRYRGGRAYMALTSAITTTNTHHGPICPQWLVSVSRMNMSGKARRVSNSEMVWIREEWSLGPEWEEDNHEGTGVARKFFLPVNEFQRSPCPCKDEVVKQEGDYVWSEKLAPYR